MSGISNKNLSTNGIRNLRDQMESLKNKSYFNYGGQGPLPSESLTAIISSWKKIQELGPFTNDIWPYIANETERTKKQLANLCGVSRNRVALTENVTSGCVLPLWGLPFNNSERILLSDCEHPGVIAACKEIAKRKKLGIDVLAVQKFRNGIDKEKITNQLVCDEVEKSLKPNTKLVVISHILWNTGQLMPIKEIADLLQRYRSKPYLLVDAAQSFGHIPVSGEAKSADIFAFTGHKWACGPEGLGGVVISERMLNESSPTVVGWKSLKKEAGVLNQNENLYHEDGRRFEIATSCVPLLAGLRSSISLMESVGDHKTISSIIRQKSLRLWEGLNQIEGIKPILEGPPPTGLVSFIPQSEANEYEILKFLGKQNLWIRVLEDPSWLRACVHVMSSTKEIDLLIRVLKSYVD